MLLSLKKLKFKIVYIEFYLQCKKVIGTKIRKSLSLSLAYEKHRKDKPANDNSYQQQQAGMRWRRQERKQHFSDRNLFFNLTFIPDACFTYPINKVKSEMIEKVNPKIKHNQKVIIPTVYIINNLITQRKQLLCVIWKYYKLILRMWQMLSFKNLRLGALLLLGQVAMARQLVKKSTWEKTEGNPEDVVPEGTCEKTRFIDFHLLPREGTGAWVSCSRLPYGSFGVFAQYFQAPNRFSFYPMKK